LSGIEVDIICAIPDPHIERWLLLDSEAFKRVLGRGCDAPDQKCIRDRYKVFLRNAILQAGRMPILGGLEHTYEIVNQMDLRRMESSGESLGTLIQELRRTLEGWTR
jgi:hypothetical protein